MYQSLQAIVVDDLMSFVLQEGLIQLCQRYTTIAGNFSSFHQWNKELLDPSRRLYCQLLKDLGLAQGSTDALIDNNVDKLFMPHTSEGYSLYQKDVQCSSFLEPGDVVTCEPGLYLNNPMLQLALHDATKQQFLNQGAIISSKQCGSIRLSDDILIQQGHNLNLTSAAGMVKAVDDIESMCN